MINQLNMINQVNNLLQNETKTKEHKVENFTFYIPSERKLHDLFQLVNHNKNIVSIDGLFRIIKDESIFFKQFEAFLKQHQIKMKINSQTFKVDVLNDFYVIVKGYFYFEFRGSRFEMLDIHKEYLKKELSIYISDNGLDNRYLFIGNKRHTTFVAKDKMLYGEFDSHTFVMIENIKVAIKRNKRLRDKQSKESVIDSRFVYLKEKGLSDVIMNKKAPKKNDVVSLLVMQQEVENILKAVKSLTNEEKLKVRNYVIDNNESFIFKIIKDYNMDLILKDIELTNKMNLLNDLNNKKMISYTINDIINKVKYRKVNPLDEYVDEYFHKLNVLNQLKLHLMNNTNHSINSNLIKEINDKLQKFEVDVKLLLKENQSIFVLLYIYMLETKITQLNDKIGQSGNSLEETDLVLVNTLVDDFIKNFNQLSEDMKAIFEVKIDKPTVKDLDKYIENLKF